MKKLIYSLAIISTFGLISCGSTKDTAEAPKSKEAAPQTEAAPAKQVDQAAEMATQPAKNERSEEMSGSEIVERAVNSLHSKLGLNDNQLKDITGIINQAFIASGKKLDDMFPAAQGKELGKSITKSSQASISALLDDTQKIKFNQFLNK